MNMFDLYNNLKEEQSIYPQVVNADIEGSAVDLKGFNGALVVFNVGAEVTDTWSAALGFKCLVYECDTSNGSFTAVDAADLLGTQKVVAVKADEKKVYAVGYRGKKRYIKAYIDEVGTLTHDKTIVSASIIKGLPEVGSVR